MSNYETIHEALTQRIVDNWDSNATPVVFDNQQKAHGATSKNLSDLAKFMRFNVFFTNSEQAEISDGTTRKRIEGFIQGTVFKQHGTGARISYRELDTLRALFELQDVSGVTFRTAEGFVGVDEDGFDSRGIRVRFFGYITT